MGSGKTTVGKRLARRLALDFVDADRELEARCGVTIPTIFELEGEPGFRRRESALLDELTQRHDIVIATGGGVVGAPDNRRILIERCCCVYLHTTPNEVWLRTRRDRGRPLLQTANPRASIAELMALREPMYREVGRHVVETGQQPVERVVAAIVRVLGLEAIPVPGDEHAQALVPPAATPPAGCAPST